MSPAFHVAAILAVGWNLMLTIAAYVTGKGPFRSGSSATRVMDRTIHRVPAEIGRPEFDARTTAWKRGADVGGVEHVQARVTETSQEASVAAPYAKASVTVATPEGEEGRRCSVCMN